MLDVLRAIFTAAFFTLWPGGTIVFLIRARAAQNEYLRRFGELEGVPLDGIPLGVPRAARATIWEAMWEYQLDPELESLRRAMWARWRWLVTWIFGLPLTVAAIIVVLILTGHGVLLG